VPLIVCVVLADKLLLFKNKMLRKDSSSGQQGANTAHSSGQFQDAQDRDTHPVNDTLSEVRRLENTPLLENGESGPDGSNQPRPDVDVTINL
jgi:hypothetical protein